MYISIFFFVLESWKVFIFLSFPKVPCFIKRSSASSAHTYNTREEREKNIIIIPVCPPNKIRFFLTIFIIVADASVILHVGDDDIFFKKKKLGTLVRFLTATFFFTVAPCHSSGRRKLVCFLFLFSWWWWCNSVHFLGEFLDFKLFFLFLRISLPAMHSLFIVMMTFCACTLSSFNENLWMNVDAGMLMWFLFFGE